MRNRPITTPSATNASSNASPRGSRRAVLKGIAAGAVGLASPTILRAQGKKTLAFWTTQRSPAQQAVYDEIWKGFEKQNPGFTVAVQYLTEEEYLPKLTSALAAGAPPALMSHLPPEFAWVLNEKNLLSPMDEVIKAVGEADFYANSLELLKDREKNIYPAVAIVNSTTTGPLWYRKDMLSAAGQKVPATWKEFIPAAKAMTRGGIFGTVYPFGKTSMGDKLFLQTIWQAGGYVFNPDLSVAFNSPQVVRALEFVKQAVELSPPSAATYAYAETINVFVQGRVATAPYSGRIMTNVQDTKFPDKVSVMPYPHLAEAEGGRKAYVGDFQSLVIPKGTPDFAASKAMALWLFKKDNYIKFLLTVPGHNLPNLKSIAASPDYLGNALLEKYKPEVQTMQALTAMSRSLLKESPQHKINVKAGAILNSRVMVEAVQDVIVGGVSPKDAAARGADKIAAMMKG